MRRCYYFILFTVIPAFGFSQSQSKHSIYLEAAGNAVQYSMNYEYRFPKSIVGKIGGGMTNNGLFIPLTFGKVFFGGAHHLETSFGVTYAHYDVEPEMQDYEHADRLFLASFFGYRNDKPDRRFFFKIGFTPFYLLTEMDVGEIEDEGKRFIPYFGFGGGIKMGTR
jgi:hypothetical protein